MVNTIAPNPHKIDTPGADLIVPGRIKITRLYWFNPTSSGDLVKVVDKNGNVIWEGRCEANNESQLANIQEQFYPGYAVTVLGSGTLYVYHE
jgi:hypothetical protein